MTLHIAKTRRLNFGIIRPLTKFLEIFNHCAIFQHMFCAGCIRRGICLGPSAAQPLWAVPQRFHSSVGKFEQPSSRENGYTAPFIHAWRKALSAAAEKKIAVKNDKGTASQGSGSFFCTDPRPGGERHLKGKNCRIFVVFSIGMRAEKQKILKPLRFQDFSWWTLTDLNR